MTQLIRTIDAHVGGQVVRLIVEGLSRPVGKTLERKREWIRRYADDVWRAAVLEPRGHVDITAGILTDAVSPEAHAGLLFMDADGHRGVSGHGIIGAATIALERGLLANRDADDGEIVLVFDCTSGTVPVRARIARHGSLRRVDGVVFTAAPSFVHAAAHPVALGARELRVDIAFGGVFHAIVDTEAVGIPLERSRVPELRRLGADIIRALNTASRVEHPLVPTLAGIDGVIFTGPPHDPEAHLRSLSVTGSGLVNRSPSGTGTAAIMAVLDAMGLLPGDQLFVHESLTGALFRGRARRRALVAGIAALVTEIEGAAWVTGEHTLYVDDDDPLREGFRI